jgi:chemotaxis family two-component system sensor kinase Cph1
MTHTPSAMHDTSSAYSAATLTSCESEKLHLSGRIQSFGALMVLSPQSRTITHLSANCEEMLGISVERTLGCALTVLPFYTADLEQGFALEPGTQQLIVNISLHDELHLDVNLIMTSTALLLEWEPTAPEVRPIAIHQMHKSLVRPPSHKEGLDNYLDLLVSHVRTTTGMDRVMVYRFRDDWAGEVIAESVDASFGSYKDMRFPAGDIPEIARKLYVQNPYRMIPDAKAPMLPVLSIQVDPPDLSASDLRSVSPMHLQYMDNMGVRASFSVPICVMGRLWGLVTCHHYQSAKLLSLDQRQACGTLVAAFSLGISSHLAGIHLQTIDSMDRRIQSALQSFVGISNPLEGVGSSGLALAGLVNADGFAMAIGEEATISGHGPALDGLSVIDEWFLHHSDEYIAALDTLTHQFPANPEVSQFSCGLLAVKVWNVGRGWLRFYWFRQAETQHITWAGNPDKPRAENSAVPYLSPRRSFEKWVEERTGYCREWTSDEKVMVARFRSTAGRLL